MSFFSDLFEGNFGNLGTDIVDAPSSLINHPTDLIETIAAPLALTGIGLGADALLAGGAGAADLGLGAAGAAGAADLGAADAAFGAFDPAAFAAGTADAGLAGDAALGGGALAGDLGATGLDAGLTDAALSATGDASLLGPSLDPLGILPEVGGDIGGGALAFAPDVTGGLTDAATLTDAGLLPDTSTLATGTLDPSITGTAPAADTAPVTTTASQWFNAPSPTTGMPTPIDEAIAGWSPPGITDQIGSVLSSPWTRIGLGAAPLALALFRGEPGLPGAAQQAQGNAAALSAFGQQQLAMGQAGQLNAGQMALIQKTQQDLTNAARQAMFNMGVQNPEADTRWPQMLANIDTQVTAMTAQMIQQEISNGLNALGSASGTLNQVAQMQMNADQNFTNTLVGATKALGLAAGGGIISQTTTTRAAA